VTLDMRLPGGIVPPIDVGAGCICCIGEKGVVVVVDGLEEKGALGVVTGAAARVLLTPCPAPRLYCDGVVVCIDGALLVVLGRGFVDATCLVELEIVRT